MTSDAMWEAAAAHIVYFGLFALGGYRRGLRRELLTLGISCLVLACLIAYLKGAPLWPASLPAWTEGLVLSRANLAVVSQSGIAMALWILACLGTYGFGWRFPQRSAMTATQRLAGAALAMGNGLLYWLLLVPWLSAHITLQLNGDALPGTMQPLALPLTAAGDQTQGWLAAAEPYGPTALVILGIGVLIYFMSRMRRPRLHRNSRIR